MAAHRYWRLRVISNWGGNQVGIGDVEMRTASGGTNLSITGNGTAFGDGTPAFAFDGIVDGSNNWFSASSPVYPQYIGWDFGSGNAEEINHLTLKNSVASTTLMINSVALEYSDDGSSWAPWMFLQNAQGSGLVNTFQWQPLPSGSAELTAPFGELTGGFGGAIEASIPWVFSGAGAGVALLTAPAAAFQAQTGVSVALTAPAFALQATGVDGVRVALEASIPFEFAARAGAAAALAAPGFALQIAGSQVGIGRAALTAPGFVLIADGIGGGLGSADLSAPSFELLTRAGSEFAADAPGWMLMATGTGGGIGRLLATAPAFAFLGAGRSGNVGSAFLIAPPIVPVPLGRAALIAPGGVLVATGNVVEVIAFEAYAVNLKAAYKGVRYYPVTRFTQFPFLKVVRWKDAYYGIAADGLYRIEGDTDHAEPDPLPIPWRMETGTTDFRTREKKRAPQLYIGGRMGPSATAKVIAGEKREFEYDGSTPRGQTAQNYRIKFGKGLNERFYAFGLSDEDGGDLQLNTLDIDIAQSERAI